MRDEPGTGLAEDDAPVPHATFKLDGVPRQERYDLWRDSIACVFEVEAARDVRDGDFEAEIDANMFGQVMLARTQTLEQRWHRSPGLIGRDGMDHYMIQLYEHGDMLWETPGGLHSFPKDGLVVFDLSREIVSRTNNFANISLFIPRVMLEEHLAADWDQHLRVLTGREPMVQLLRDHMSSLKRLSPRMSTRQAVEIAPATVGLAAACLNAAVSEDDPRQRSGVALARLTIVRRFIERHLGHPDLAPDWVARQVGLSRTKLYELFELYGGVARYIRDRRLRQALMTLTDRSRSHLSNYDVALSSGYSSDAAFIRAFRQRYGVTPNEVRIRGALDTIPRRQTPGVDRRHEDWVRHLSI